MRKILAFGLIVFAMSSCLAEEEPPKENVKDQEYYFKPFWDPNSQVDPGFAGFGILSKHKFKPGKPNPDFTLRPPSDTSSTKAKREAEDDKHKVPVEPFFDLKRTIAGQLDSGFARKPPYDISSIEKFTSKPDPGFTIRIPRDAPSSKFKREAVDEKYKVPVDPFFDLTRTIPSQLDPGFALKPPYDTSSFEKFTSKPDPGFTLRPARDTSSSKVKREAVDEKYKVLVDPFFDPTRTVPSQLDPGFALKPPYDILSHKFTGKPDPDFTLRPPSDTSSTKAKREAEDDKYKVPVEPFFDLKRTIAGQIDSGFARKPPYDISSFEKVTSKPDPGFTIRIPRDAPSTKFKREAVDEKYKVPVDPFFDPARTIPSQIDPGFAPKLPYDISSFEKFTSKPDPGFTLRPSN